MLLSVPVSTVLSSGPFVGETSALGDRFLGDTRCSIGPWGVRLPGILSASLFPAVKTYQHTQCHENEQSNQREGCCERQTWKSQLHILIFGVMTDLYIISIIHVQLWPWELAIAQNDISRLAIRCPEFPCKIDLKEHVSAKRKRRICQKAYSQKEKIQKHCSMIQEATPKPAQKDQ